MTSPGGTGTESGDDYVAARLSIDIPSDGISGIRELTDGVDRFRTSLEAAGRAEADMSNYLTQMTAALAKAAEMQANLNEQLGHAAAMQGGGGAPFTGVGATYQQPFQGMSGPGLGAPPGARQPNPTDVIWQLQASQAANNPHSLVNMAQARGAVPTGPGVTISPQSINQLAGQIASREHALQTQHAQTGHGAQPGGPGAPGRGSATPKASGSRGDVFDSAANKVQGATGFAGQVLNEIGAHQGLPFANITKEALDSARGYVQKRQSQAAASAPGHGKTGEKQGGDSGKEDQEGDPEDPNGSLGGGMGMASQALGAGSAITTAVASIFKLVQSGGAMVQGWRNIASTRGGAAGEGMEVSAKARGLAMDPFVSTEQSRQVYQALLSEGYANASGEGGDDVKRLMVEGIKEWNMGVGQMVEALRLTAKGTEVSTSTLADYMGILKERSKNGWLSLPDQQALVQQQTKQLEAQGVNRPQAWATAMQTTGIFSNDPDLAGTFQLSNSPGMNALERQYGGVDVPRGLMPQNTNRYLTNTGKAPEAQLNVLQNAPGGAKWCQKNFGDTSDGKDPSNEGWLDATSAFFTFVQQVAPESDWAKDQDLSDDLYNKLVHEGESPHKIIQDQKKGDAQAKRQRGDLNVTDRESFGHQAFGQHSFGTAITDRILGAYHGDKSQIEVMDEKGKVQKFDPTNQGQQLKLAAGQYKWRHKGDKGAGISEIDTPDNIGEKFSTDRPFVTQGASPGTGSRGKNQAGADNKVMIELSPEAKKFFSYNGINPVPITPNDVAANSGQGDAALNNPPAGNSSIPAFGGVRGRFG